MASRGVHESLKSMSEKDQRESRTCQTDIEACSTEFLTRVRRRDGEIKPICKKHAADLLGVSGETADKAIGKGWRS